VIVTRVLYQSPSFWKSNSHLIQVIVVPRHSEYMLTNGAVLLHLAAIKLVEGVVPFDPGVSLKNQLQLLEHLICSMALKTVWSPSSRL
jgi:hypothetical protein